ncbi:restriction endonuclease [Pyrobaculum neutrophilum]|uniref:Restriction endonuclease type IV Mrr domain-containing protein n=1 Tax=Pyrobaculum neutrophilum (strain DSM 2338 / JCM 9278 / NBRC 100436 / V24Sta) TaxID=444157 RepID=B1Y9Q5_PYRNV|nr:restriction endonuclease [Pyrobaculum neutrophilum]ACB38977.1 conserved hypothetical protein [Pyrobaculum neutrophilum V24Sta]
MAGLEAAVKRYLAGDRSALEVLRDAGFLDGREPSTRGYVLYKALKLGIDVSSYARYLDWREFEEFIRHVFSEFGYMVASNVRLSCGRGAEFDVVAWSREVAFVAEAKRWKGGRWSEVARRHLEKVRRCLTKLQAFAPSVVPLVVTSTEAAAISDGVPIVPIGKIGNFLASFHDLKDQIAVLK